VAGALPDDVKPVVDAWHRTHPDFAIKVWGPDDVYALALRNNRPDIVEAMKVSLYAAMASDIARLAIMNYIGGVYSDLKNFPVASFLSDMLAYGVPVVTQHPPTIPNYERVICNAFFSGPSGHVFFSDLLNTVVHNVNSRKEGGIFEVTGGGPLMKMIGKPFRKDIVVKLAPEIWGDPKTGKLMKRISASYNGKNLEYHWSKRQSTTGIYRDTEN
jgi:mannosyltransferase OCH1-like enzyme